MQTIRFKDVLKGKPSSLSGYELKEVCGVYIYGLLLDVLSEEGVIEKKFCPLAVGESKKLRQRLIRDKYKKFKTGGTGVKELFNFSKVEFTMPEIISIYKDMSAYDLLIDSEVKTLELMRNKCRGEMKHLIYYQDFNVTNAFLQTPFIKMEDNKDQIKTIAELKKIHIADSILLSKQIELTKQTYEDRFYFVLATNQEQDNPDFDLCNENERKKVETCVKRFLRIMKIYTTEKENKKLPPCSIDVDLSEIKDILITF